MRHVEGRKEKKADEEIKGGHSAYELERSSKEWGWDCGECNLEEQRERERENFEGYKVRKIHSKKESNEWKEKNSFFFFLGSSCIFKYYNLYLI